MNTFDEQSIPPVEETAVHKTDVLDWSRLEAVTCDLDFRDEFHLGIGDMLAFTVPLLTLLSCVSVVAWAVAHPVATWIAPALDRTPIAVLSVLAGAVWAVWGEVTQHTDTGEATGALFQPAALGRAFLPPLLWQAITLTGQLDLLAGAFSYYCLVGLPFALLVFDRFATHAVYWITASPTADHAAITFGRHAWTWRLFGVPAEYPEGTAESDPAFEAVVAATSGYRWGLLWITAATLAPPLLLTVTLGNARPTTLGLQIVLGTSFGLLAAMILRSGGDLRIVPRFFRMLVHWFYYGSEDRLPPWVFRSPCGGWLRRQAWMLLAVGLLAIPVTSMAAHSFAGLHEALRGHSPQSSPWLWIAPTVLVALVVAPLNLCLIGILLTGRGIATCCDAFETTIADPPPPTFPEAEESNA